MRSEEKPDPVPTKTVENQKALKAGASISKFPDSVKNAVDLFLTDSVMTTSIVVGGVFFASDKLFWVEKLSVYSSPDFICKKLKNLY